MAGGEPQIPKEQIDALVAAIEKMERRRRIMLWGYIASAIFLVVGQLAAFVIAARVPPGTFIAWVFLVPFALVGATLYLVGRLTRRPQKQRSGGPGRA